MKGIIRFGCAALAVSLLAGCTSDFYDSRMRGYTPQMPEERYPIDVVKGAVKVRLPIVSGKLSAQERDTLMRLGQGASSLASPIYIIRPSRSVKGEVMAAEVTRVLTGMGINPDRIRHRTGGARGEIVVTYRRKFAVTKECGDWSKPINETASNEPYPNFGCTQQHNLAAMVDNPEDFERPRVMSAPDADTRNEVIRRYRKRIDTSSSWTNSLLANITSLAR